MNDGIDKDSYCGIPIKLMYPTIDTLAERVAQLKPGVVLLYKRDLARYFRQILMCPKDYSLIGMRWRGLLYFDKFFPMGLRSAAYVAQHISSAITYIHRRQSFWSINYLDDYGSAEKQEKAWESFLALETILKQVGAVEATEKAVKPSVRMDFLGMTVGTEKMTLEVSAERRKELLKELKSWRHKQTASKRQLQSLMGKLSFVTNVVRPGRIFMSRLIEQSKCFPEKGKHKINAETRKDIEWWIAFLPQFDGVSMLWLQDKLKIDEVLAMDVCLNGGGACCESEFFHFRFPDSIKVKTNHITQLELLTIVIAVKLWIHKFTGKVVRLSLDNQASVWAVNQGKTKDSFMLQCLCEIAWFTAKNQVLLKLQFIDGSANIILDLLSRWYISGEARRKFKSITNNKWKRRSISNEITQFVNKW